MSTASQKNGLNGSQGTDDPHTVVSAASLPQDPSSPRDSGHEEYQYLNLIREILANGEHRPGENRYRPGFL